MPAYNLSDFPKHLENSTIVPEDIKKKIIDLPFYSKNLKMMLKDPEFSLARLQDDNLLSTEEHVRVSDVDPTKIEIHPNTTYDDLIFSVVKEVADIYEDIYPIFEWAHSLADPVHYGESERSSAQSTIETEINTCIKIIGEFIERFSAPLEEHHVLHFDSNYVFATREAVLSYYQHGERRRFLNMRCSLTNVAYWLVVIYETIGKNFDKLEKRTNGYAYEA